ncbi:MAG: tetratricopeptide repeat protein [Prolixibacteraceae bacterium]|nr:tetratricopeptide repeat protein [Prolixibacteraceae bacterium]
MRQKKSSIKSKTGRFVFILIPFIFSGMMLFSQNSKSNAEAAIKLYSEGTVLFDAANWGSALHKFEELQATNSGLLSDAAAYYIAASRLEFGNSNGEAELKKFIEDQPESPLKNLALFRLATLSFNHKKYKEALQLYQQMETTSLTDAENEKYLYNSGISLLETREIAKAKSNFDQIRGKKSTLGNGAKYYWGHISYLEGHYDEAIAEFSKLENNPAYFKLIPYYQVQINFAKGSYQEVLNQGAPLLAKAPDDRKFEVARIMVSSFYQLEQYQQAADLIDRYFKGKEISRADCYVAGFCYEKIGRADLAIQWYEKSVQLNDAIAQGTYYQLGSLYMKRGDKQKGLQAFQHASEMKFNPKIRQDALFQYAKAAYELDYSPFNESIKALDKYIAEYPEARENDLAYNYLVNVFMTTHNYKDALVSMDRIKVKSPSIKKAYQRVTLYRGMELFRDLNFAGALKLLDKSLEYGSSNTSFKAQAQYWRAETLFRLGKSDEAFIEYKKFQAIPGIQKLKEYPLSFYNIGYQYFNKQELIQATTSFSRFAELAGPDNEKLLGDVYNRLGDCQYANRNFEEAIGDYQKARNLNVADADYSLFQIAFTHGLMQDQQSKLEELAELASKYPESPYCDDALFETGKARERLSDFENAKASYKSLMAQFPKSPLIPKALAQLGLIAYNQNQYDASIALYKELIDRFPDTPEARGALTGIKNNYMENNQVEDYISYTKKLGKGATPSQNEQDSLTYFAAEKLYMAHAPNASEQLTKYLNNFPQGNFTVNAHFYKAECAYNAGEGSAALLDYDVVLAEPSNLFTENALIKAAGLAFDAKEFGKSLGYFQRLESMAGTTANVQEGTIGTLRCQYELGKWEEVVRIGWKLRSNGKLPPELDRETSFKSAKAYDALKDPGKALPLWRKLSADPKSQEGAEAKYNVCKYYADNNRLKDAENEVMDFIAKNSPQKYWLGKSFILLAHIYERMNDLFQATNTLKSVIENYDNKEDGIVEEATAYLKVLEQKK